MAKKFNSNNYIYHFFKLIDDFNKKYYKDGPFIAHAFLYITPNTNYLIHFSGIHVFILTNPFQHLDIINNHLLYPIHHSNIKSILNLKNNYYEYFWQLDINNNLIYKESDFNKYDNNNPLITITPIKLNISKFTSSKLLDYLPKLKLDSNESLRNDVTKLFYVLDYYNKIYFNPNSTLSTTVPLHHSHYDSLLFDTLLTAFFSKLDSHRIPYKYLHNSYYTTLFNLPITLINHQINDNIYFTGFMVNLQLQQPDNQLLNAIKQHMTQLKLKT